ncbi:MAG TPA: hypothetical protein VHD35_04175 [Chitinophagaceae bacterium]|nr:hypothetical protein [Chitinophagaceae bacterium]
MKTIFIIGFALFLSVNSSAQLCEYAPADCPDETGINTAQYLTEGLIPQEIEIKNQFMNKITDMMLKAAKQLHWQGMELGAVAGSGPLQAGATPYEYRSPRMIFDEWQFIVDKDSITAWKNWLEDFGNRSLNNLNSYTDKTNEIANSPLYKAYSDSIDYYMNKSTEYIQNHQSEGLTVMESKGYKSLQSKINDFIDKRTKLMQPAEKSYANPDTERILQTARFREGATLHIEFYVNYSAANIKSSDNDKVQNFPVPGSFFSKFVTVASPIISNNPDDPGRYKHFLTILLGKWSKKMNQYNGYNSQFADLPGQNDEHTLKKIKSDKIQTITVYIMGSEKNIQKILPFIDILSLDNMTTVN